MRTIESTANPAVRRLVELRKRRNRTEQQRFLIEGIPELRRAIAAGIGIETLFVTDDQPPDLETAADSVILLSGAAAARAFVRERGGGVIGIAVTPSVGLDRLPATTLAVVAEAIEKPGNLGAMMRSADAAGAGALLVCDPTVDLFNPNVIRASLGTVFTVPVAIAPVDEAAAWCRERSVAIMALDPGGTPLYAADLSQPIAMAVGAEHDGLSTNLRAHADQLLSIPMAGDIDSLNAATALAIGLFEAVRQRSGLRPRS